MKIAFVHPDLGIGGAERLIVDAAVALQEPGNDITIYTSHYSESHCFEETKGLRIVVRGDFLPRSFFGYFHLLFATLRCLYLALWMFFCCPSNFDVIVADQISFHIPILKKCSTKVLFYCHFPDKFLAPTITKKGGLLPSWRKIYRWYFDSLEERTIGKADRVVVNSHFTGSKFKQAFPSIRIKTDVLYPSIKTENYEKPWESQSRVWPEHSVVLSLNRFERKKRIDLAIEVFSWLKQKLDPSDFEQLRLVIAGGYDPRVKENIEHLKELQNICKIRGLTYQTIFSHQEGSLPSNTTQVLFLPSISEDRRNCLLHTSLCLLYTPSFEHFGIVPVEAMYCGTPVIAVNNGGPRETVINGVTGFLCEANPRSFGHAVQKLISGEADRTKMSKDARDHVKEQFTMEKFSEKLSHILKEMTL